MVLLYYILGYYTWNTILCFSQHINERKFDLLSKKYSTLIKAADIEYISCDGHEQIIHNSQDNQCLLFLNTSLDTNVISDSLHEIVHVNAKWTSYILIYTQSFEELVKAFHLNQPYNVASLEFSLDKSNSSVVHIRKNLKDIFKTTNTRTQLNFLLFAEVHVQMQVLNVANEMDRLLNQQGYFTFLHRWLLITDTSSYLNLLNERVKDIQHVSAIILEGSEFYLYPAMWKLKGREFEKSGSIDKISRTNSTDKFLFPNIKNGFNGKHFRIASQIFAIYTMATRDENNIKYSGVYIDFLNLLSNTYNFTYEIKLGPGGLWGSKINGTWNGVVGLVYYNNADISVAAMTTTPEREEAMDFVHIPITQEQVSAIYRTPKSLQNTLYIFTKIFKVNVWIVISIVMLTYPLLLWMLSHRTYTKHVLDEKQKHSLWQDLSLIYYQTFASSVSQSVGVTSTGKSQTVAWMFWWIYSLILVSIWSGNLISFEAVELYPDLIPHISEIHKQSKYSLGTQASTAIVEIMPKSSNEVMQNLWTKMQSDLQSDQEVLDSDTSVHMRKVLNEDYIFMVDAAVPLRDEYNCTLTIIPGSVMPINYFLGLQKNSAYKEIMTEFILKVSKMGLHEYWHKRYTKDKNACFAHKNKQVLEFNNFVSVLICMFGVLGFAGIVLLLEIFVHNIKSTIKNALRNNTM